LYTLQQTTQQIKAIEEEKYPPDQSIPKSEKQEKEEKNDKKEEQSGKKETEDNEDEKTEVRESPVDHQETAVKYICIFLQINHSTLTTLFYFPFLK